MQGQTGMITPVDLENTWTLTLTSKEILSVVIYSITFWKRLLSHSCVLKCCYSCLNIFKLLNFLSCTCFRVTKIQASDLWQLHVLIFLFSRELLNNRRERGIFIHFTRFVVLQMHWI